MAATSLTVINAIRKDYIDGCKVLSRELATELGCHITTVQNYRRMCRIIEDRYPDKLKDYDFRIKLKQIKANNSDLSNVQIAISLFPEIIECYKFHKGYAVQPIYAIYKSKVQHPCSLKIFWPLFVRWREKNNICFYHHLRIKEINPNDLKTLKMWRNLSADAHRAKRAIAILASYNGAQLTQISKILGIRVQTIIQWYCSYREGGLQALIRKNWTLGEIKTDAIKIKQDNLVKLVHQTPRIFNINRNAWRFSDLVDVYQKEYGHSIGRTTARQYLKVRQYGFRKSRESLTSNDPKFREKLDYIKSILANLTSDEKFFSVDEYGHFAVKIKGGRSIIKKPEVKLIPQIQKSKGVIVVTAALELSTNQVTHFYSAAKNTFEMIKMIDLLCLQYTGIRHLYISWDAAIWHRSKLLKDHLEQINSKEYREVHRTPIVKLAPLPTSAQFLNVIESVFSGLSKAVIHSSDYGSVEECKAAIDLYFKERNEFFLKNPKKAGKVIWGKELVKAVFDETNNCDAKK